jgi:hypothetical protein
MRGRFLFLLVCSAGAPGCARHDARAASGHLHVERTAPGARTLVDGDAAARFCDRDGTLTITAIGGAWSAALALRTAWPPRGRFAFDSALGGIGSAALAARAIGDSLTPPLIARSGSVDIDSGGAIAGHFSAQTGADSNAVHLAGRFEMPRRDSTGCAGP